MKYILSIFMVLSVCFPCFAAETIKPPEQTKQIYLIAQTEAAPAAAEAVAEAPAAEASVDPLPAEAPNAEEPKDLGAAISMGQQVASLVKDKNWSMAMALLIVLLVWGYKKLTNFGLLSKWLPAGGKKTTIVAMIIGVLLQVSAGLVSGQVWYLAALQGLVVGGAATGLWDLISGQKIEAT